MSPRSTPREAVPSAPVLPARYVVVVEEAGAGVALEWALSWAALRSVPVQLAGPPGTFTFSRSFLSSLEKQLLRARHAHPGIEITAAPGGTCELRPDDLVVTGVDGRLDDVSRSRAARLAGLTTCSTVIVPPPHHPPGTGIVAAIGSPDRGRPIARMAAAEAEMRDESLTLLHVETDDGVTGSLGELAELVAREYPTVTCVDKVARGPLIQQLAAHASEASLMVMGPERVSTPDTTLGLLARMTPTPVLIARPAYVPD